MEGDSPLTRRSCCGSASNRCWRKAATRVRKVAILLAEAVVVVVVDLGEVALNEPLLMIYD